MKRGELERRLKDLGWRLVAHRGSHDAWGHPEKTELLMVPRHAIVRMGTARSLIRQAGGTL
jgi:predicted RNA binding protein YcfA (HicA-like mRNA interferase family)